MDKAKNKDKIDIEARIFINVLHLKEEKNKEYSIEECEKNIVYLFDNFDEFRSYFETNCFHDINQDLLKICRMKTTKNGTIIALKGLCDYAIRQHNLVDYCNQVLIPSGGTTSWMVNCEERNYRSGGYYKHNVSEIKISEDSRIEVDDFTQPAENSEEEFFTSITFYKKELDNYSIYAPHVYDRGYTIYYPYGTRFNEKLLKKIGCALNCLINNARDLDDTTENQEELKNIANKQKQLIELFITGTNDKMAVEKIIGIKRKVFVDSHIRVAKNQKDWLPYFNELENKKVLKK